MPKASPLQPSFSGGEFSPKVKGRSDSERYKTGLATCLNYLPTTQGPLCRRPGFKYSGVDAKDPSKPPAFLEFKFSQAQNYVIEAGDFYMRFFTNNGQIITSSTNFQVFGNYGTGNVTFASSMFYAMRTAGTPNYSENIITSAVIAAGSVLEIGSPYSYLDVPNLKVAQKDDTLYITHSSYPEYKLQRLGSTQWELKRVHNQDGPYLPLNSYRLNGDSVRTTLRVGTPLVIYQDGSVDYRSTTGPIAAITAITSVGTSGTIQVLSSNHGKFTGDRIVILGCVAACNANNGTSSISSMYWKVNKIDDSNLELIGSVFTNNVIGSSGFIYPALFEPYGTNTCFNDVGRSIGLIRTDGGRAWGRITEVLDMARFGFHIDSVQSPPVTGTGSGAGITVNYWQLGVWNRSNGYPGAVEFHQDRKTLGGTPYYPQRIDMSVSSYYDNFAASGSSLIVSDNNALSFGLNSAQLNKIAWIKSADQGLLAGSLNSEWNIAPNNQAVALTPTNINAKETSYFGSHDADAVQAGNSTLYIQRAQRRIREMNYFFQVNTYRSTDLAELSDHLTNPGIAKLVVQKETLSAIWGLRTDGQLTSMSYSRDDVALKVGWARHTVGGKSDSGGAAPVIKSIAVIPSPDGTYDSLWIATKRFINGTSVLNIEYSTKIFEDKTTQEDAFQVDCGATYDAPLTITGITTGGSSIVTAAAHGFANDDSVKISVVVGLNSSVVNVLGNVVNSNLVNGRVFIVGSTSTNAFFLKDFDGNYINSTDYSVYVSGGQARKLVSTISGLTWLKNEDVAVLADGGIHPITRVNSAGVLALSYPAAKVQIGLPFNSDAQTLRPDAGSGDGSAIGKMRRVYRAAFMVDRVGELSIGSSFDRLTPLEFNQADNQAADTATPLFTGIVREGLESEFDFEGQVCFRQSGPLPGMIQAIDIMLEENDV